MIIGSILGVMRTDIVPSLIEGISATLRDSVVKKAWKLVIFPSGHFLNFKGSVTAISKNQLKYFFFKSKVSKKTSEYIILVLDIFTCSILFYVYFGVLFFFFFMLF